MSMEGSEGFICPYCLVGFGTSGKLQNHFVDMHSGQGLVDDYDEVPGIEEETSMDQGSPSPPPLSPSPLGHNFQVVRQPRPKGCDACSEIIWQDALMCQTCHVTVHMDSCPDRLTSRCSSDAVFEGPSSMEQELRSPVPGQNPRGILPLVRRHVSKGRDRYVNEEFDLDLTYITERIIAMSFPATGVESAYRNNLKDVAKMLKTKHEENYMIFNLSERSYDISRFNNQVLDFGWPDHLAPSLERLSSVCKSIKSWLDSEPLHVAVVHCKGGKGRTGCVIAAFMHYTEICHSAAAALDRFAMKRFYDNKMGGVTQPSQKKYVHYFADLLSGVIDLQSPPVVLHHVLMHGIPNFDGKGGCRVFIKIYENMKLVHTSGLYVCTAEKERVKMSIYGGIQLQGEVLLKCFHKKSHGMDSVFRCQFPSAIVKEDHRLVYRKADLDDSFKDKRFTDNIKVELLFGQGDEGNGDGRDPIADIRTSLLDSNKPASLSNGTAVDLSHDILAKRDSYVSFPGGFDNGVPSGDMPDLMGHEPPPPKTRSPPSASSSDPQSNRERTESSTSFHMDPEDIQRVTHRSQVYTVINKPFKQQQKPGKSTSDVLSEVSQVPSQGSRYGRGKRSSDHPVFPPARPPPPNLIRKQGSAESVLSNSNRQSPMPRVPPPSMPPPQPPSRPADQNTDPDYADYADVDDTSPTSSTENSPFHRPSGAPVLIKQSSSSSQAKIPASERILLDVHTPGHQSHRPPTSPSPTKTPEHSPRPFPAARPTDHVTKPARPPELAREIKKLDLHNKYTKIVEEQMRKQLAGAGSPEGMGDGDFTHAVVRDRPKLPTPSNSSSNSQGATSGGKDARQANKPLQRPKPPKGHKVRSRPSYAEVEPDFEIIVEPVSNRVSQDNIWMRVKHPTMPRRVDGSMKSSSSSNLTSSDYYSNLAELHLDGNVGAASEGSGSDSLGRRRHSFSEGEDKVAYRSGMQASDRESMNSRALSENRLDQIEGGAAAGGGPDYKNLQYNEDGSLNMDGEDVLAASFGDQIKLLGNSSSAPSYENTRIPGRSGGQLEGGESDDYMNDSPEGWGHIYSNQEDLLLQMQAENIPLPEEVERALPPDSAQRLRLGSGASILRFLKNNILKPKPPTEIHSGSLGEAERDKTLAPFAMQGVEVGRVNRDYEAFFTSAWGGRRPDASGASNGNLASSAGSPSLLSPPELGDQPGVRPERLMTKQERPVSKPLVPANKPRSKTGGDVLDLKVEREKLSAPAHGPQVPRGNVAHAKRTPLLPPSVQQRPPHPQANLPTPTSANPPQQPRPHPRLKASNSDATVLPRTRLRDDRSQSIEPPSTAAPAAPRHRRGPPPVPPPPFQNSIETQVRSLMPYWYKPKITREEAIEYVLPMNTGSFIVRDSSTVKGGYALTLKITETIVRTRKKLTPEDKVTEDMLVTHFLIQPDPVGVKLQGWNEKPFKSLTAFIAGHVMEKMCVPCKLVLPDNGGGGGGGAMVAQVTRRQPAGIAKAMQSGAACDLIFLGSVDVATPGSDSLLAQTVQQLQTLDLSTMNVVTIAVSRDGITLQENVNGSYLKRQYPFSLITYCGLDPVTRWSFPSLHHLGETVSLTDKICFGIVHRPVNAFGFSCMVFAEYDAAQPVSSVVNFIQKMMREHKHSSKYMKS